MRETIEPLFRPSPDVFSIFVSNSSLSAPAAMPGDSVLEQSRRLTNTGDGYYIVLYLWFRQGGVVKSRPRDSDLAAGLGL